MCENHDGLSHRSISEQRRLRSPSVDEQETELEPSLEQEEEENEDHGPKLQNNSGSDGAVSPSRKKEIMVDHEDNFFYKIQSAGLKKKSLPSTTFNAKHN